MKKNIRIKDIAQMAEVSMGTVDRVIHKRGKVSKSAYEKVMKVLDQIDYKPNLIAKTLSSSKTYQIAVLLPDAQKDPYWQKPIEGIIKAEKEFGQFGIQIHTFSFNSLEEQSFEKKAAEVLLSEPDGVLLAPILRNEALAFAAQCHAREIPVVCFNTYIEALHSASFIGQDLHQSGRLAAELITSSGIYGTMIILNIAEKAQNSVHLYEKEQGFREFIGEVQHNGTQVITCELDSPAHPGFEKMLDNVFQQYPSTQAIFVTTSRAYDIAQYLEKTGKTGITLVGYDLIEDNIPFIERKYIHAIIHQNAQQQSFLGVSYLTDLLVFKKEIPSRFNLPLHIITRENLHSYLQSE